MAGPLREKNTFYGKIFSGRFFCGLPSEGLDIRLFLISGIWPVMNSFNRRPGKIDFIGEKKPIFFDIFGPFQERTHVYSVISFFLAAHPSARKSCLRACL